MLRAIQAAGYFFPDSTGGTEVYVGDLAHALHPLGCESTVVAPGHDLAARGYDWQGVPVERFPWSHAGDPLIISGRRPHRGFDAFLALLDRAAPDIYHQHSWTGGCGHHHLRAAKERGFRCVTTVHLAGNVCLSGTMMRMGERACDGRIDEHACSACWAVTRKRIPPVIAAPLTRLSRWASSGGAPGARPLSRLTAAFDWHRERFEWMDRYSDRIVVVCQWLYDALLLNGIGRDKLVLCRQGVGEAFDAARPRPDRPSGGPLRIGFLGRLDPAKGLDLLLRALRRVPAAPLELRVYGIANDADESGYADRIRAQADADPRVRLQAPIPRGRIRDALSDLDVLAVPSQVMETGPLVALEALAAGTPVLGSRLGGLAELVTEGVSGWLVAHESVAAWAESLAGLCRTRASIVRPSAPVRSMREVAQDTMELYKSLVARAR